MDLRLPTALPLAARFAVGRAALHAHPDGAYAEYGGAWLMTGVTVRER